MDTIYLRSRTTKSTEYKSFEISGYKGSVIIELYETKNKKTDKVDKLTEKKVLVGNVDIMDGKGMTRYENQKFGVKDFESFLLKITGETFHHDSRKEFFHESYYSTPNKAENKITNKSSVRNEIPKKVIPPVPNERKQTNIVIKPEVVMDEDGEIEVNIPIGPTDVYTVSKRRKEQPALRAMLMKDAPNHLCAICGNLFPNDLLVAAHIKKRKHATEEERKNTSIVVPMCKLGCDSLFEDGWVGVSGRRVTRIRTERTTPHLELRIQKLVGKECLSVNEISSRFYDWHRIYHTERMLSKQF